MSPTWVERSLNPLSHITRDDGRICLFKQRVFRQRSKTDKRKVERLLTACKDEIIPREISGATFYPTPTEGALTCAGCLAERDKPKTSLPSKIPYMPY